MINNELLYDKVFSLYLERGVRFTMDDLADALGISKRTLYEQVSSKEQLAFLMVERYFDEVSARQEAIYSNGNLDELEKIKLLLTAMPTTILDKHRLNEMKREYPNVFDEINLKLARGWEKTFDVIDVAKEKGIIADFDENLFKLVYVSAVEAMLLGYNMMQETSFSQMQSNMVDLLLTGILAR